MDNLGFSSKVGQASYYGGICHLQKCLWSDSTEAVTGSLEGCNWLFKELVERIFLITIILCCPI